MAHSLLVFCNIILTPVVVTPFFLSARGPGLDQLQFFLLTGLTPVGVLYAWLRSANLNLSTKVRVVWGTYFLGILFFAAGMGYITTLPSGRGLAFLSLLIFGGILAVTFIPINLFLISLMKRPKESQLRLSWRIFFFVGTLFILQLFGFLKPGILE